jgi:hypothetical protein
MPILRLNFICENAVKFADFISKFREQRKNATRCFAVD